MPHDSIVEERLGHDAGTAHVLRGPTFVVAPRHRLICIVQDRRQTASLLLAALSGADLDVRDVWVFVGRRDGDRLDPRVMAHGARVAIVRVAQRLLTSDCEYCERLVAALDRGAYVLAFHIEPPDLSTLARVARENGAHSIVYGQHWNFTPLPEDAPLVRAGTR